jgi:hypothetical protein
MKYILLMSGTKAGVDTYRAWSQKDIEAHMAVLGSFNKELTESGASFPLSISLGPLTLTVSQASSDATMLKSIQHFIGAQNSAHHIPSANCGSTRA